MSYESTVSYGSKGIISTLDGQIRLDQGRGRIAVVRNNIERGVVDADGFTYSEDDGKRKIRIGANPFDGRTGAYIVPTGPDDVIDELMKG